MKTTSVLIFALAAAAAARADFSYNTTRTLSGMPQAAAQAPKGSKRYFKGQKMRIDNGDNATIIDFDAQTITNINNKAKTYTVKKFSDLADNLSKAGVDVKADVKNGESKSINGYDAKEVIMTLNMDMQQGPQGGMKAQIEVHTWVSPDVPGAAELHAFYKKNGEHFPWSALAGGGQPGMQKAMADMQRRMAELNGVPVLQVVKVKGLGGPAMDPAKAAQMAQARAKMEELQKQGGPAAAAVAQALARMNAVNSGSGSLFESSEESNGFSTAAIPDSVFAIPAGYRASEM